jgi:hypothetical protein
MIGNSEKLLFSENIITSYKLLQEDTGNANYRNFKSTISGTKFTKIGQVIFNVI